MEELGRLAIFLVGTIVGYFLKYFFAPYFGEKGKNLATKQDIQEITEKIEGVRAYLNVIAQQQMNLFIKRSEALTQFFEDSYAVSTLLRSGKRYEDVSETDKLIREIQDRIVRAVASYHRLTLYVQDESILSPALKARTVLAASLSTWWRPANKFRDALAEEIKEELELAKNPDGKSNPSQSNNKALVSQAFKELQQATDSIVDILDDSLKEYSNALNTHFHSVDKSKALTATTGI